MSEEEKGQLAPELEPAPEKVVAPEPSPVVEKYKGKTPEELVSMLEDSQKHIGKQAQELGDVRNEMAYLRGMVEQGTQRQGQEEPTRPYDEGKENEEFFSRPMASVEKVVTRILEKQEQKRQQESVQREGMEAKANYEEGRDSALRQNKRLFDGIERQVEQAVYESYRAGILNKSSLRNPKTWERAGQLIRLERGTTDDLVRIYSPAPKPVQATPGETPQATKPWSTEDVPIEIDEETRQWAKERGLSDKETIELIRKELEAKAQGKNKSWR